MNVERVLVPVVVRGRDGHTIDDLRQQDFQVFDNGKPRAIFGFAVERRGSATGQQSPSAPSAATGTITALPTATIFLFDDMHLDAGDLAQARIAGMNVVSEALTGNNVAAVVSISGTVNTGLTRDPAKLQRALEKLALHPSHHPSEADCPYIDYYEADQYANKHDPSAVEDVVRKYYSCKRKELDQQQITIESLAPADRMQLEARAEGILMAGNHDVSLTLATIAGIIQGISQLPAQRSLILISPGFLTIDPALRYDTSRMIDLANRVNVSVSTLDARGLYTQPVVSQHSSVQYANTPQVSSEYERRTADLSQDVMAEIADGTGGIFFHNCNDLQAGLRQMTEEPETVYEIELPVGDLKHNGTMHLLNVKIDRHDVRIAARHGYFMPRPNKKAN